MGCREVAMGCRETKSAVKVIFIFFWHSVVARIMLCLVLCISSHFS